jgi:hypothetical protein
MENKQGKHGHMARKADSWRAPAEHCLRLATHQPHRLQRQPAVPTPSCNIGNPITRLETPANLCRWQTGAQYAHAGCSDRARRSRLPGCPHHDGLQALLRWMKPSPTALHIILFSLASGHEAVRRVRGVSAHVAHAPLQNPSLLELQSNQNSLRRKFGFTMF